MRPHLIVPFILALPLAACAGGGAAQARRAMQDPVATLAAADLDQDGRITRPEFAQSRARLFERMDRNGDGYVSESDAGRRRRGGGDRLAELRRALDADGDGRISQPEFVGAPGLLFDRADANGDQIVDRDELNRLRQAAAERRERS